MAAVAILDFGKFAYLPRGSIKVGARCMLLKFGENRFILAETINIFRNSRWRRRHLGFWKICIFAPGSIKVGARCMLLKFGENRFILAETINIFRNSRWRPSPSWILENSHIYPRGSIKVSVRCMLLKFGENRFILAETINIFRNSRWRPPPSWILENLHICPGDRQRLVPGVWCWNLVRIASFLRKLLAFFKIQDGGRRHLGFSKFSFFAEFSCAYNISTQICEIRQWSVYAFKGGFNFSEFWFWLEFSLWGPFWRGFWG